MAMGTPDYDESDRDWMDALDAATDKLFSEYVEEACSAGLQECEPDCPAFGKAARR